MSKPYEDENGFNCSAVIHGKRIDLQAALQKTTEVVDMYNADYDAIASAISEIFDNHPGQTLSALVIIELVFKKLASKTIECRIIYMIRTYIHANASTLFDVSEDVPPQVSWRYNVK